MLINEQEVSDFLRPMNSIGVYGWDSQILNTEQQHLLLPGELLVSGHMQLQYCPDSYCNTSVGLMLIQIFILMHPNTCNHGCHFPRSQSLKRGFTMLVNITLQNFNRLLDNWAFIAAEAWNHTLQNILPTIYLHVSVLFINHIVFSSADCWSGSTSYMPTKADRGLLVVRNLVSRLDHQIHFCQLCNLPAIDITISYQIRYVVHNFDFEESSSFLWMKEYESGLAWQNQNANKFLYCSGAAFEPVDHIIWNNPGIPGSQTNEINWFSRYQRKHSAEQLTNTSAGIIAKCTEARAAGACR